MGRRRLLPLAVVLAAWPALADAAPRRAAPPKRRAIEAAPDLYGGYSYTRAGEASLNGWSLSGSLPRGPSLSLVAELSGHYGTFAGADLGQLGFLAGVRWTWRSTRLSPFAEALLGGVRTTTSVALVDTSISESDIDWGTALGGGADYRLTGHWSARGLFHLRLLHGEGTCDSDPRLSVGAIYRFGR
jgi:hypothetical protein